ncbi:MAG TPA: thiamine-phosphate kinase [Anaeromyxobacteraceae bacterium]|nr:thiamine-phosphate kinase [Anaeromyxobacteraceae bacterium]
MPRRRPLGEFELIDLFTRALPLGGEGVRVGVGDDAAALAPPRGELLVVTADAVVDGVHFDRRFRPEEIGWKALAVNLSDLAAMGARPLWALVALGLVPGTPAARIAGIARGLGRCARAHGVAVVGGNVTRARQLSLTVTALGGARPGLLLRRDGAHVGDAVLVSGTLGDAALGLGRGAAPALVRKQRMPEPRLALGRALAGIATAAVDVSDGLVQDLGHLCRASGVGASLRLAELPLSAAYRRAVRGRSDPWAAALAGGEDYELAVTTPVRRVPQALRAARRAGTELSVVGSIVPGSGVQVVRCQGGLHAPPRGHDHLSRTPRSLTSPAEPLVSVLP